MLRFPAWKIVSILAMTAFALLLIVPSLLGPDRREALISHLPKWVPAIFRSVRLAAKRENPWNQ